MSTAVRRTLERLNGPRWTSRAGCLERWREALAHRVAYSWRR
jgi:hypothetical protein